MAELLNFNLEQQKSLEIPKNLINISSEAIWTVSSAKTGHGVDKILDKSTETFWQSDGILPHLVNIQFQRKMKIARISIYIEYSSDESYTPRVFAVSSGTTFQDLKEITQAKIKKKDGWAHIELKQQNSDQPLHSGFIQIAILRNHINGNDSHIRQIQIFGKKQPIISTLHLPKFSTIQFQQYANLK
ncbi:anaphase-promoting complex subunit [Anaeramoeba flamelloides]|uniref:Anaphase-promoting complex subunit 10 n=1 Tax=Anaeramoeba flamelloides TaxID=1746091 RepID=A0AAV7ZBP8_9EUKA|nr:anaphase-promoting complex subunit [Anaeramoeba flamelloides]